LLGGPIINIAKRPGEPDCTFADISKIKILLKWEPQITIEVGVNIMIECIDNWKDAPVWDEAGIRKATESWFKYLGK
jgi:UDP-glucose 4-epimerase